MKDIRFSYSWKAVITLNFNGLHDETIYIIEDSVAIAIGNSLDEMIKNFQIADTQPVWRR